MIIAHKVSVLKKVTDKANIRLHNRLLPGDFRHSAQSIFSFHAKPAYHVKWYYVNPLAGVFGIFFQQKMKKIDAFFAPLSLSA